VLAQYLSVEERPPEDIHVIAYVVEENEPVDHERVKGILVWLLATGMLTEDETEAAGGAVYQELVGT